MIYNSIINSNQINRGTRIQMRNGSFGIISDNARESKKRLVKFDYYQVQIDTKEILSASIKGEWKVVKNGS